MIDTSGKFSKGFDLTECRSLLELCIDLNNGNDPGIQFDTSDWTPIFTNVDVNGVPRNIGPFENAWKLWQRKSQKDVFAVVVRGTIGVQASIIDDVIATSIMGKVTIQAHPNRYLTFTLAQTPCAETHLGFTYGIAVLMFAKGVGILQKLKECVPPHSKIYITGHSQGAAIATLAHAFLHYAINDPNDKYALGTRGYSLKSYFFAQPKPGNWQFALDFARIAASKGTSFVIDNDLDWVPQVPLSIEFLDEPGGDIPSQLQSNVSVIRRFLRRVVLNSILKLTKASRMIVAGISEDVTVTKIQQSGVIDDAYLQNGTVPANEASSINYALAGNLIPVFGSGARDVIKDGWLTQHHATTYRELLNQL